MKARILITGCALGMLLLSSCGVNEDLYDPAKVEERLKAEYKTNFVEKFGEFDSNYSWDATSAYPKYASTRADDSYFTYSTNDEGYYEVEAATLEYLQSNLVEGKNNRDKGEKFLMTVPNNAFTIVPIYQGSGLSFEFHVVIGNQDITMWTKGGEGLQKKGGTTQGGGNHGSGWWGGSGQSGSSSDTWTNVGTGTTIGATAVRGIKYTFDATAHVGEAMYFYLKITRGDNSHAKTGTNQSSLEQMIVALTECPVPANLDEGTKAMIIGCEDGDLSGSDWDMNDIVFLVYGNPDIPKPIEIINNEVTESTTKRYMIEDLGSTDDFDFNDVVVDVTQTRIKTLTIENGKIDENKTTYSDPVQKAVIRHLGGTLPFTLTIGGTQLDEMQGKLNVNPNTEFTVTGWNPESNNISMKVNNGTSGNVNIDFPADGEVPMIIAVDEDVDWMDERVAITKEWFESIKK